jgi:hypothetical protein
MQMDVAAADVDFATADAAGAVAVVHWQGVVGNGLVVCKELM